MSKRFVTFLLSLFALIPVSFVAAANLADNNDVFQVISPSPNAKIEGVQQVQWIMYDDDAVSIPYTADLLDASECIVPFGSITSESSGFSHQTNPNTFSWNTNATQSSTSLQDGSYCLRICVQLLEDDVPYSSCNSRIVTIVNNNELPVFSQAPNSIVLNEQESWSFSLQAVDPDNDSVSYSLLRAPDFLRLNRNVLSISQTPIIPNDSKNLVYTIEIAANDSISGSIMHSFTITITNSDFVQANPTNGSSNNDNSSSANNSEETQIIFIKPKTDQIINTESFEIEWEIQNAPGVLESIEFEYSEDGEQWVPFEGEQTSETTYNWNTGRVLDGAYFIRAIMSFADGSALIQRSDRFVIDKNATSEVASVPLILNVVPQNEETQVSITKIEGDLVPSQDATIDPESFQLQVDEDDVTESCNVTEDEFQCLFEESFSDGIHEATASVSDSSNASNLYTWQFTVGNPADPDTTSGGGGSLVLFDREIERSTFYLLVFLSCLTFLILFIPWALYAMWRRDDEGNTVETFETTIYPTQEGLPNTTVTTNYYQPSTYTPQPLNTTYVEPQQTDRQ